VIAHLLLFDCVEIVLVELVVVKIANELLRFCDDWNLSSSFWWYTFSFFGSRNKYASSRRISGPSMWALRTTSASSRASAPPRRAGQQGEHADRCFYNSCMGAHVQYVMTPQPSIPASFDTTDAVFSRLNRRRCGCRGHWCWPGRRVVTNSRTPRAADREERVKDLQAMCVPLFDRR
jgi:hypothetical protein